MANLGDRQRWGASAQKHDRVTAEAYVDIGASGAATLAGDPSILTCVKNTTGVYDVTFDPFPAQATSRFLPQVWITKSATPTVAATRIIAFNPTAGTMQFATYLNTAGTPVEPANGDQLAIRLTGGFTGIL